MMELYKKYRPTCFNDVIGQDAAVLTLTKLIRAKKVPHALILSGPSGVGKTTIARILQKVLDCADWSFEEINAADTRGIDTVRAVRQSMSLAPIGGKSRIFLFDEAHQLTKKQGGDAQT